MKMKGIVFAAVVLVLFALCGRMSVLGQSGALPAPGFHHLHLNSVNPDKAIDFYAKEFPTTSKSTWGGLPALKSPNNVLLLFSKVDQPPATQPQTAVWHFGWHVTNERQAMARMRADGVTLLPLYATEEGGTVNINASTFSGNSTTISTGTGGATYNAGGTIKVNNSTFSGGLIAGTSGTRIQEPMWTS